ncbi:MAG: MBL fold metallo-hydrolase [bacterium]|nr:MBL fold metallo-hydrolase [bacterium]
MGPRLPLVGTWEELTMEVRYVAEPGSQLLDSPGASRGSQLLLGQRLHIDPATQINGVVQAGTMPDTDGNNATGWVALSHLSDTQQLKVFYVDVGQGDACLIEADGKIVIIDGGPHSGFHAVLKDRLAALRRADEAAGLPPRDQLHIDAVFVSHFGADHYKGLIPVLNNGSFTFGTIFHNGIARYAKGAGKDLDLGTVVHHQDNTRPVTADLDSFSSVRRVLDSGGLLTPAGNDNLFAKFLRAVIAAQRDDRLDRISRLVVRKPDGPPVEIDDLGPALDLELLGPVATTPTGTVRLPVFADPHSGSSSPSASHTVNGNSVVLRLGFGECTFLFGGDLNQPSQEYLTDRYADPGRFQAHVNKACHHGSSDFDLAYLKAVKPHATVFSSGDAGQWDHPLPDAIGTAARWSPTTYPLVLSTELARDTSSGGRVKHGHINARSNGSQIVMAQRREKESLNKTWHSYPLPYQGPFGH